MRLIVEKAMHAIVRTNQDGHITLDVQRMKSEPEFLWDEIFIELLHRMNIEPTEKNIGSLHRLCAQPTGRMVELRGRISVYRDRETIVVKNFDDEQLKNRTVEFGGSYDYRNCLVSVSTPVHVPSAVPGHMTWNMSMQTGWENGWFSVRGVPVIGLFLLE